MTAKSAIFAVRTAPSTMFNPVIVLDGIFTVPLTSRLAILTLAASRFLICKSSNVASVNSIVAPGCVVTPLNSFHFEADASLTSPV